MAALYRDWEDRFCAEFHYVSSCPFQMWGFVDEFLREEDFPEVFFFFFFLDIFGCLDVFIDSPSFRLREALS